MKKYTTTTGQEFKVEYAGSLPSGYGHQKISSYLVNEEGDKKEFVAITSDMPGYDEANDLEGQERYEALFNLVDSFLDYQISEWIAK